MTSLLHASDHEARLAIVEDIEASCREPEDLYDALAESLADPHASVRERVALVLGDAAARDPGVLAHLLRLAQGPGPEPGDAALHARKRLGALHALGRAGLTGLLPEDALEGPRSVCAGALEDASSDVRYQAAAALRRLGTTSAELGRVRVLLGDEDREVAALAAELLSVAGDDESLDGMLALRQRVSGRAWVQVTLAIGDLTSGGGVPVAELGKLCRKLPQGLHAIEVLGKNHGAEAQAALRGVASGFFVHRLLRVAAAAALAGQGDARGWASLRGWMGSWHRDARGYAITLCGPMAEDEDLASLIAVLADPRDYHSDTAAIALAAHSGAPRVLAALRRAADDPRAEVREEVADALRRREAQSAATVQETTDGTEHDEAD